MPRGEVPRQLQSPALCVSAESDHLVLSFLPVSRQISYIHLRHGQCIPTWQIKLNTATPLRLDDLDLALLRARWRKGVLTEGSKPLLH